ncbi:M23 family metallopeptidase [Sinomicrobium weinanense]|uniref:M23 family metallopeptidase n=1 Tax=Sinomicrobium weinanense TaxID=2842200 RepID=A0A926JTL8_9FLAO|nr:M23 family metallopeptidase [Sinomicrobium weinanense]MBC9797297.1 M23 family metallopeptidase [Sinomicrobium weinanense]MBU3125430.1 M23 family metallopeptidase [Sinomicrobium weinanense]
MSESKPKRKKLAKKLLHKYRLVILNEDTFEERLSFRLNRLNVFVVGTSFAVFLIAITTMFIAFTPLREYIPGYSSTELKRQVADLTFKTDSLVNVLDYNDRYIENVKRVLTGEVSPADMDAEALEDSLTKEKERPDPSEVDLSPGKEDLALREEVALEDKYNLVGKSLSKVNFVLFPPVSGAISNAYNLEEKHFAVDIPGASGTPVKAAADGIVIFAEWTVETGYVCIIEHSFGLISVYKHNGSLSKSQGELVKAGEVIATMGNTGELTTGPHLHFELWSNGYPVNPTDYIDFD